jgi:hypothetical protein
VVVLGMVGSCHSPVHMPCHRSSRAVLLMHSQQWGMSPCGNWLRSQLIMFLLG